jgi:hypothetical protein
MATTLPASTDYTGASVTQGGKKTFVAALRSFIADLFGTDSTLSTAHGAFKNVGAPTLNNAGLSAAVAGGALTIALKTAAGADPSATDPVLHSFRSATAGTGTVTMAAAAAAQSLVIPSTATMGATSAQAFRLWIVQFNDAGTLRLGAVNCLSGSDAAGWSIYPLRDDVLASSTAVSAAADSAHVIYTGSAVTTKAMRVLGWMEWSSGLTTAGTWDAAPTKIQMYAQGQSLPGQEVQVQQTHTGAVATGTTTTPNDDTIPQSTEGDQYMTQAITPTSAANVLAVRSEGSFANSAASPSALIAALFKDAVANALKAAALTPPVANGTVRLAVDHAGLAAGTSAVTFKLRVGNATAGTTTFNGGAAARTFGGVNNSFIRVTELMA